MLRKEQNIVRHLVDMLNPTMTAQEMHVAHENIRLLITTGWQTDEHPSEQMTVADELEHVLFFITDVLYRAMPPFYEDIENAVQRIYGEDGIKISIPVLCHFASWVGGDMDGNPNVNAKDDSCDAGAAALADPRPVLQRVRLAVAKLSQTTARVGVG